MDDWMEWNGLFGWLKRIFVWLETSCIKASTLLAILVVGITIILSFLIRLAI